jgi:hypothetical protein
MSMWQRYEAENQGTLFGFQSNKYWKNSDKKKPPW